MSTHNTFTPEVIIAGARKYGSVQPKIAAFEALATALGTESIAMITKVVGDKVHYVGSSATYFVNQGLASSPILSVLSGPDGAYILDEVSYSILVVKEGDDYDTYSATLDQVRHAASERGLEPIVLSDEAELGRWETISYEQAKNSHRINKRISLLTGLGAIALFAAWGGMAATQGYFTQTAYNYDLSAQNQIAGVIRTIPTYQPVDVVLSEMSIAKAVAVKSGGWINRFEVQDNRTGLDMMMPAWVTDEYIKPLGRVKTDPAKNGLMIHVTRTLPKGDKR